MVGTVSSDCPSSQELLRQQLASRAAGWDRPASSLRLQGSFIHLSLAANITVCNLSYPIPRIHANLISLKYYYYSPWAARSRNKAISKQPPNPTGQVPQILQGKKNTHFAEMQAKSISHALNEIYKAWHTLWCALTINLHTHSQMHLPCPVALHCQVLHNLSALKTINKRKCMFKTVRWRERESTSLLKQEKSSVPRLGGK